MRLLRRLLRPFVVRLAWELTTHDGFNTPCDDDWHCVEVRDKGTGLRGEGGRVSLCGIAYPENEALTLDQVIGGGWLGRAGTSGLMAMAARDDGPAIGGDTA